MLAGFITKTLKLRCNECVNDLASAGSQGQDHMYVQKSSLLDVKDRGGLTRPSKKVFELCLITERAIGASNMGKLVFRRVIAISLAVAHEKRLQQQYSCATHAAALMRVVVRRYVTIRLHHITNTCNELIVSNRRRLNRLVIFNHM